jgi:hypothetical protein
VLNVGHSFSFLHKILTTNTTRTDHLLQKRCKTSKFLDFKSQKFEKLGNQEKSSTKARQIPLTF